MITYRSMTILLATALIMMLAAGAAMSQTADREFNVNSGSVIEITNLFGRVDVVAASGEESKATLKASSSDAVSDREVRIDNTNGVIKIIVVPSKDRRIDLHVSIPERTRLKLKSGEGELRVDGNYQSIDAVTATGTIAVNVPVAELKYTMLWTASRPRFVSDITLEKVRERSAGRFEIKGNYRDAAATSSANEADVKNDVSLNFSTARGIVLLNVPPNEVTGDLRERPLTNAAKAIIRSGDRVMMDAIRRAAPKYFGDYERTLPPVTMGPNLSQAVSPDKIPAAVKRATVHVYDTNNRTITGLNTADFEVTEGGVRREVISVKPVDSEVNLVLLLDVSGSIENYVTFIRKAARSFVDTVDKEDRISIITFGEDVNILADFSTDRKKLSESLDTFDAGGATSYYDALGYTIAETLRPLRDKRTAVVILTDGDDNRSFLAFDLVFGAVQESGAIIYPLYVPSSLIAASAAGGFQDIDPLRNRHLTLSSKADGEGKRLAEATGGLYFPITQLSQINTAYADIVEQLRTAYEVTYHSDPEPPSGGRTIPRARIRVNKPNTFVQLGPVVPVR